MTNKCIHVWNWETKTKAHKLKNDFRSNTRRKKIYRLLLELASRPMVVIEVFDYSNDLVWDTRKLLEKSWCEQEEYSILLGRILMINTKCREISFKRVYFLLLGRILMK